MELSVKSGNVAGIRLTPDASAGVVNRQVHVLKVSFAHEATDLRHARKNVRVTGNHDGHWRAT